LLEFKGGRVSLAASLVVAGMIGLTGCGGGCDNPVITEKTISGVAIDGYLHRATVNFQGVSTETNETGGWTLTYTPNANESQIVTVEGGTDTGTGEPFEGILKAPIEDTGETVVTPITTLVAAKVEKGEPKEEAIQAVATAMGVSPDIITQDPIKQLQEGNNEAATVIKQSLMIQKMAELFAKATNDEVSAKQAMEKVFETVANHLNTGTTLTEIVKDATVLANVKDSVSQELGEKVDTSKLDVVVDIVDDVVTKIADIDLQTTQIDDLYKEIEIKTTVVEELVKTSNGVNISSLDAIFNVKYDDYNTVNIDTVVNNLVEALKDDGQISEDELTASVYDMMYDANTQMTGTASLTDSSLTVNTVMGKSVANGSVSLVAKAYPADSTFDYIQANLGSYVDIS